MASVKLDWISNDDPILKSFDDAIKKAEDMEDALQDLGKTEAKVFEGISKDSEMVQKALNEGVQSVKGFNSELDKSKRSGGGFRGVLSGIVDGLDDMGAGIRDRIDELKAKRDALTSVTKTIGGTNKSLRLFKVALAGTGIGLIVVALGSLVTFLSKTQKGIDFVNTTLSVFSSIADNVIEKASQIGEILFNVFSGETSIREGIRQTGEELSGFGDELLADAQAAATLERASQSLRESQRALSIEFAQQRAEMEELKSVAEDTTKTFEEREAALEKAISIENDLESKRLQNARENLRIITERNELGNSLTADLEAQAAAEIELAEIQAESEGKRRENVNQLNAIRKESADQLAAQRKAESEALQKLADDYDNLAESISNRVQQVRLSDLTGIDRLKEESRIAIEELDKTKAAALALAQAQGKELPESFLNDIDELVEDINRPLQIALERSRQELLPEIEDSFSKLEREVTEGFGEIEVPDPFDNIDFDKFIENGKINFDKFRDELSSDFVLTFGERIGQAFDNLLTQLEIDEEDLKGIASGINTVFGSISSSIAASNEAELEANQRIIDQLDERVSQAEDSLNRELELKKAGLANNFDIEKENLEKIEAQREEARERNLKLEEEAAKRQAAIDTITQAQGLITSSSQIFKAFSAIPFVGVPLAIAAIGSMFAFFAKAKIDANKAAQIPAFREGTESVQGEGTPTSDSILARLSVKERVVPYSINKDLLEAGILNKDLARYAIIGQQIMENGITAIPQFEAANRIEATRTATAQREAAKVLTKKDFEEAVAKGVEKKFNELIKTNAERPHYFPTGAYIEKKKIGNTFITKKIS